MICLSTTVRNDTLQDAKEQRVSVKCRKQLRVEEVEMVGVLARRQLSGPWSRLVLVSKDSDAGSRPRVGIKEFKLKFNGHLPLNLCQNVCVPVYLKGAGWEMKG